MQKLKIFIQENKPYIYMVVLWSVLWIASWGRITINNNLYLSFVVDMIKLGIALVLFILPGVWLYLLLRSDRDALISSWGIPPIGFALSVSVIAVIGIVGRLLGLSFVSVRNIFVLTGLCEIFLLAYIRPDLKQYKYSMIKLSRAIITNTPLMVTIILAISMTFNGYQFFIDDTSYAAYIKNWQESSSLGFVNLVHQLDKVEEVRFWLALYPMGQALLADLSGVPGILLLSNYIEIFLVPLAVVASYNFARDLKLSRKDAGLAVFIQTLFYVLMIDSSWPVGFWFFQNMAEDKVTAAFLLAPVFFGFLYKYIHRPTRNNSFLILLCGLGLMFTHPVILFLTCTIAVGFVFISWLVKKIDLRILLQIVSLIFLLLLPYVVIRQYDDLYSQAIPYNAESVSTTYQSERYVNVVNELFYGLNPEVLKLIDIPPETNIYSIFQIVRFLPVATVLVAAIVALTKLSEGGLYWYILVCVLLVIFATIPFTGWILGYFISARMISRVSWFSPLGLSGMLLLSYFSEKVRLRRKHLNKNTPSKLETLSQSAQQVAKGLLAGLVLGGIMLVSVVIPRAPVYFEVLDHNLQLAQVGKYIDRHVLTPTTVIALDYSDIQMLPGVSARASLISFREEKEYNPHNYFFSVDEINMRMSASNIIRSLNESYSSLERCSLINNYNVKFVVANRDFVEKYLAITANCEMRFVSVYETKDLVLLEYR